MEKEQFLSKIYFFTNLISMYLNKKEDPDLVIDDAKFSFLFKLASHHSLNSLLYKVLKDTKVQVSEENLKKLEDYYLSNLRKDVLFAKEREALYKFLNDNQIHFLPLKGLVLRDYYPDPYTREYADNDILFGSNDKDIKKFFVERGYKCESFRKGNHDVYVKKPFFNFEMHRDLFIQDEKRFENAYYFAKILEKTTVKKNFEHCLSDDDFYIYFTAHTFGHFIRAGCGIRTLIDYYVYLRSVKLKNEYVNTELKKLNIVQFSHNIRQLSLKIFDTKPLSDDEKEIVLYIASSGTYGTIENSVDYYVREKGKFRYLMYRLFPPLYFYKRFYPWAYYTIILIPAAWLLRFIRILFTSPRKATNEIKTIVGYKEKQKQSK